MTALSIETYPGAAPVAVSPWIFRSWTGRRFIDGRQVHGPVITLGTDDPTTQLQARACPCATCQTHDQTWRVDPLVCVHTDDEPGTHWTDDRDGNEYRVDCGCPCLDCAEY